jgi:hypothetical protein
VIFNFFSAAAKINKKSSSLVNFCTDYCYICTENKRSCCVSASGLQLFIAKDGTTAFGSHEVKRQASSGAFQQVVMDKS